MHRHSVAETRLMAANSRIKELEGLLAKARLRIAELEAPMSQLPLSLEETVRLMAKRGERL